jgi:hypothetical protein
MSSQRFVYDHRWVKSAVYKYMGVPSSPNSGRRVPPIPSREYATGSVYSIPGFTQQDWDFGWHVLLLHRAERIRGINTVCGVTLAVCKAFNFNSIYLVHYSEMPARILLVFDTFDQPTKYLTWQLKISVGPVFIYFYRNRFLRQGENVIKTMKPN